MQNRPHLYFLLRISQEAWRANFAKLSCHTLEKLPLLWRGASHKDNSEQNIVNFDEI